MISVIKVGVVVGFGSWCIPQVAFHTLDRFHQRLLIAANQKIDDLKKDWQAYAQGSSRSPCYISLSGGYVPTCIHGLDESRGGSCKANSGACSSKRRAIRTQMERFLEQKTALISPASERVILILTISIAIFAFLATYLLIPKNASWVTKMACCLLGATAAVFGSSLAKVPQEKKLAAFDEDYWLS